MTDFDETAHPRATDGTFTEKNHSAPEVALPTTQDDLTVYEDALAAAAKEYRQAAGEYESRIANFVAASILAKYPNADSLILEESDQPGCTWTPSSVIDADGEEIAGWEDVEGLTVECWDLPSEAPYLEATSMDKARMDLRRALAHRPEAG